MPGCSAPTLWWRDPLRDTSRTRRRGNARFAQAAEEPPTAPKDGRRCGPRRADGPDASVLLEEEAAIHTDHVAAEIGRRSRLTSTSRGTTIIPHTCPNGANTGRPPGILAMWGLGASRSKRYQLPLAIGGLPLCAHQCKGCLASGRSFSQAGQVYEPRSRRYERERGNRSRGRAEHAFGAW